MKRRAKMVRQPDRTAAILHTFGHLRPVYESLVAEVLFAIHKGLSTRSIKTATVFGRVKEPQSLADKIDRRNYTNLSDITDLAGARIVCMYSSQLVAVESFIREEFKVIEHLDKSDQLGADRMGYQGLHFLARLLQDLDLSKYRTLKDLDGVVERAKKAVAKYRDVNPHLFQFSTDFITKSLGFVDL